jgi:hypothetical protein
VARLLTTGFESGTNASWVGPQKVVRTDDLWVSF